MKLLLCTECRDIFNLTLEPKECSCGKTIGAYKDDGLFAWYTGPAIPLGFRNDHFRQAILNQPDVGMGENFTAFVIPKDCPTFSHE